MSQGIFSHHCCTLVLFLFVHNFASKTVSVKHNWQKSYPYYSEYEEQMRLPVIEKNLKSTYLFLDVHSGSKYTFISIEFTMASNQILQR